MNWKPNEASHSIASLIRHIEGNIAERVEKGILGKAVERNRDTEFSPIAVSKERLIAIIEDRFSFIVHTIHQMSELDFKQTQTVRNKERINADMLHQCVAHYSEHMGQIFYIAKLCLNESYKSTSI